MRPGLSDMYERMQSEYRARARNSDHVVDVFTFETLGGNSIETIFGLSFGLKTGLIFY